MPEVRHERKLPRRAQNASAPASTAGSHVGAPAILASVGHRGTNHGPDVLVVRRRLMEVGFHPCQLNLSDTIDEELISAIKEFQSVFLKRPDGRIDATGMSWKFLRDWSVKPVKPGVDLRGRLRTAWDLVNPLLPAGSVCTSGYRSAEEQRALLHRFYKSLKTEILKKYDQKIYDSVASDMLKNESKVLEMVRSTKQQIAAPGASAHQKGKAIDIGGPADNQQVRVVKLVAAAHPELLSGKVLKERNGCVHFELV